MSSGSRAGTVVGHFGIEVEVALPDGERVRARVRRDTPLVVGDRVTLSRHGAEPQPRETVLARRDTRDRVRAIAANLDVLGVTVASSPPAPPGYLDRALVAARAAGIEPFVVVNKCDLPESEALWLALRDDPALEAASIPVFRVSAEEGAGLAAVAAHLAGHRGAFIGTSGVGKSSLLNALVPGLALPTGEINRFTRLGRHVTTHSTLHALPGGGELIDTPGFRDFVPVDLSPADLAQHFAGFDRALARGCRFADCLHREEPDCAVTAAVAAGEIDPARHGAYLALLEALERARETDRTRRR
jgi:ribosome biogenesis GTPase